MTLEERSFTIVHMDHELFYISREELKNLRVPKDIVKMIPRTVAESMAILPFELGEDGTLMVAAGDPNNTSIKDEVQFYTGAREVRVYHGFRTAVMEAIEANYNQLFHALSSEGSSSAVDFGAQYLGAGSDEEAFPGVFGKSSLEQFIGEHKEKKNTSQGVSGSLQDMSIHDIVQVLAAARKSAVVVIHTGSRLGEVHIKDGQIINAYCDNLEGEAAFYEMVGWEEGDFKVDPDKELGTEAINKPNDALILEGLRRLDEARAAQGNQ